MNQKVSVVQTASTSLQNYLFVGNLSFSDALLRNASDSNVPPHVSDFEMKKRFIAEISEDERLEIPLHHVFDPSLISYGTVDHPFILKLHADVVALCGVTSTFVEKRQSTPETVSP